VSTSNVDFNSGWGYNGPINHERREAMELLNVIDEANEMLGNVIEDLPYVRADKIGLDSRAGHVFVDLNDELIITKAHNIRSLEYYGGFEYINDENTTTMGDYKIYGIDGDDRVEAAIEYYKEHLENSEK